MDGYESENTVFSFCQASGLFTKTAKLRQENLWGRTPRSRSPTGPFPESFQAIHWKRYAEEKTKRIKSNNTRPDHNFSQHLKV